MKITVNFNRDTFLSFPEGGSLTLRSIVPTIEYYCKELKWAFPRSLYLFPDLRLIQKRDLDEKLISFGKDRDTLQFRVLYPIAQNMSSDIFTSELIPHMPVRPAAAVDVLPMTHSIVTSVLLGYLGNEGDLSDFFIKEGLSYHLFELLGCSKSELNTFQEQALIDEWDNRDEKSSEFISKAEMKTIFKDPQKCLKKAIDGDHYKLLLLALQNGAKVLPVLKSALSRGNRKIISALFYTNVTGTKKDHEKLLSQALYLTITNNQIEILLYLIHIYKIDITKHIIRKREPYTVLSLAIQYDKVEMVEQLFKIQKIEINGFIDSWGHTSLTASLCPFNPYNDTSMLEMILEQEGVDINRLTKKGVSPLMRACTSCRLDYLEALAEHKNSHLLNVNYVEENGCTALMEVVQGPWENLFYFLLKFPNVDIHCINKEGDTALSLAIDQGKNTATKLLSSLNSPLAATRCLEEAIEIMPFLDCPINPVRAQRPPLVNILNYISFEYFKGLLQRYGAKIDNYQESQKRQKPRIDPAIQCEKIYKKQNLSFSLCTRKDYITLFSKNKLNLPKECAALIEGYDGP